MKKIIRPEGPAKKITLIRYCPKKIFRPRHKSQPPPPRISNGPCLSIFNNYKGTICDSFLNHSDLHLFTMFKPKPFLNKLYLSCFLCLYKLVPESHLKIVLSAPCCCHEFSLYSASSHTMFMLIYMYLRCCWHSWRVCPSRRL